MASAAGIIVGGTPVAYTTFKGAVIHFSKAAAIELAAHKIRVNAICPGVIATPIWGKMRADHDPAVADQVAALMAFQGAQFQPLPRAGEPVDIAEACLYLASDAGRFITGQSLVVDGGITIGSRARTKATLGGFVALPPEEAERMYDEALASERAKRGG
jgi:NAD(P)-dependent dehydrogenase (short-subunit alcohol dehydrogenase family)